MAAAVGRALGRSLRRREQQRPRSRSRGRPSSWPASRPLVSLARSGERVLGHGRRLLARLGSGARSSCSFARGSPLAVTLLALAIGVPLGVARGTDRRARPLRRVAPARLSRVPAAVPPRPRLVPPPGSPRPRGHRRRPRASSSARRASCSSSPLAFAPIVTSLVAARPAGPRPVARGRGAGRGADRCGWSTRILLPAAAPAIGARRHRRLHARVLRARRADVPARGRLPGRRLRPPRRVDYAPGEALALVLPLVPRRPRCSSRSSGGSSACARSPCSACGRRARTGSPSVAGARPASLALWLAAAPLVAPIAALAVRALSGGGFAAGGRAGSAARPGTASRRRRSRRRVIVAIGLVVGHAAARRLRRRGRPRRARRSSRS